MNSAEELREALVALRRDNERLRTETAHANQLLGALESLLRIEIDADPFLSVFESLRGVFTFQQALVLAENEPDRLDCIVAIPESLVGTRWRAGPFLRKVLAGRVSVTFNSAELTEWRDLPRDLLSPDQPALYLPIHERDRRGVLVLLKATGDGGFDRSHVALARKFSLLASHALAARHAHHLIRRTEARAIAAEDASNAKNLFIANMSHELRTPLNAIIGFSDIMFRELLGPIGMPRYKEYTQNVLSSGQHLLAIVNNLLFFAKIEAGQHKTELEPLRLAEEIDYVLRMIGIEAEKRRVRLIADPVRADVAVMADQQSLRQILLNVVGNALKFSRADGIVRVTTAAGADGRIVLRVIDRGCGIPPATLKQIGNPFVQAEGVFARQHQGTGLGLAICFGLAEAMDATISVESEEGTGTTVTLDLTEAASVAVSRLHQAS